MARPRPWPSNSCCRSPDSARGELAEQVRPELGGYAHALVRDGDGDVQVFQPRGDLDGRPLSRVPGCVGEEIVQHLDDPPTVRQYPGQVRRCVDLDAVPVAPAEKGVPRQFDHRRHVDRFGSDGERPRLDACEVQQIVDEVAHVVGMLLDDAEELEHLRLVERRRGVQHGGGGALYRRQRCAEFVADHAEELGPQTLQLFQGRYVLDRDDDGDDLSVLRPYRRRVDQRARLRAVRQAEHHLLRPDALPARGRPFQRELLGGDRASIHPPVGHRLEELIERERRPAGAGDDAQRLPVEPHHGPRLRVEDQHAHGGRIDERLEVGIDALLFPVDPRVGDGHRRLRGEHLQRLLVLLGEVRPSRVHPQVDVPHVPIALPDLQAQERPYRQRELRVPRRRHMLEEIPRPQRLPQPAQVPQDPPAVGRFVVRPPLLFLRHAGDHQVLERAGLVHRGDRAVARAGEQASAVRDLLQNGVHVERLVYAEDGPGQSCDPGAQCLVLRLQPFGFVQHATSGDRPPWRIDGGSVPRACRKAASPTHPGSRHPHRCLEVMNIAHPGDQQ